MNQWYLIAIQDDLKNIQAAAERAATSIENSIEYKNNLAPFHNSAVATYNKLVSILIEIDCHII